MSGTDKSETPRHVRGIPTDHPVGVPIEVARDDRLSLLARGVYLRLVADQDVLADGSLIAVANRLASATSGASALQLLDAVEELEHAGYLAGGQR